MRTIKRRRLKGKTDYKARIGLLKSDINRIVFRKSNRYIIGQYVESEEAKDKVKVGVTSKQLLEYGWPESNTGSLKTISACYLTGFLLGKKILDKSENKAILDISLIRKIKKSRPYAFLKGAIDAGVEIKTKKEVFPDEKRILGEHMKNKVDTNQIKQNILDKFK